MKRMIIALLSMLMLCGCTQYDSIDLQGRLQEQIDAAQSWQVSEATNFKPFIHITCLGISEGLNLLLPGICSVSMG